ncbi:Glycoside hydrolase family 2, sugar binding [Candidatus Sulfopaludibacter sp. SbA3]|nr:Glycoside hydrolase family 2, sugar binding [Candidatus Sulfopaludibacter sp. SbA3]
MVPMRARFLCFLCLSLLAAACWLTAASPATVAELRQSFLHPPDDARIMVRYWWFGPAVVKTELEREMRKMKEGGIGGFEVQPTYPMQLEGNFKYLSPEFLDDLTFAGAKAKELGLRMDLTLGSGWPFGGPHIPIEEAAGRLIVSIGPPRLAEGDKLIAAFQVSGNGRQFSLDDAHQVADPSTAQGTILNFVAGHTRQTVKRPAFGAEGFVLDHYDPGAIATHLKDVGEPMLKALAKTPPAAIFSDSLEVYSSDWTRNFLQEFRKRRGYDLLPYLPALANGASGDKVMSIRHDWGKTLSELADDNYLKPLTQWAHEHHTLFRSQSYGIPPVTLSSYQYVDLPEGEGTQWRHFSATRWAASASHLLGKPVTSSETWTWLHSPVFRATPLDMKAEADIHFLQGINQLVAHGYPYSPPEAGEPGWRFYAAAVFNDHNPWWLVMPDVTRYLQRVSFLLRQGQPANDVALYLPTDDAFAGFTLGRDSVNQAMDGLIGNTVIPQILDAGYNFDFIDDGFIAKDGVPYKVLILPNVERIPLASLQRILDYAKKGGAVIATRRAPSLAPGLMDAADTPKIKELAAGLRLLTDETKLGDTMHEALAADVATAPEVGFVHRKLPFAEVYFLANTSNHPVHHDATFRIQEMQGAWWDPFTGKVSKAGGAKLDLDLAPYESRVLVFFKQAVTDPPLPTGPETTALDLSGGWKVTFPGAAPVEMPKLVSWTEEPDRKYYSGQATYEKSVTVDRALAGRTVFLNFGEGTPVSTEGRRSGSGMRAMMDGPVREAAVVWVNGQRAGSVWCAPFEVNVSGLLHAGENSIRVVVANLALNNMAKGPLPDYKDLTAKYGERFQAQDMNMVVPQPSGLLDGVRLVTR